MDATGSDTRHASRHYAQRSGQRRHPRPRFPELAPACHTAPHLLAGAVVTAGPGQDSPQFPAAIRRAARHLRAGRVLGDAGYDAEHSHALCRGRLGIPESVFRLNPRNTGREWPRAPYRRPMERALPTAAYNQRWQVGSAISRLKRRPGPTPRSRSRPAQKVERLFRVLTHSTALSAA